MNSPRLCSIWLSLVLVVLSQAALADLYTGQGVLDEQPGASDRALMDALDEVLLRLSGRAEAPLRVELGLGLAEAQRLVQARQRVRVPVPVVAEDGLPTGEVEEQLRLQVQFDRAAIDARLAAAGVPRWGRERPTILLWVAMEDEAGARMLSSELALELRIQEQARRLGLDILRPLGDGLDLAEVAVADVRGGFLDASEPALVRYQASLPAMFDLRRTETGWNGRWFWRQDGRDQSANLVADSPAELIQRGLEAMLSSLAERYAVSSEAASGQRRVRVSPIRDQVQFAEVLRYLENLSMVEAVRVSSARGAEIEFELSLSSGGLEDALALGGLLQLGPALPDGGLDLYLDQ